LALKKSNEILLKDAIEAFLKDNNLQTKLNETKIIGAWEEVTGKLISRHTLQMYIKDRTLFVKVDSAALREELTYQRSKLVKKLNQAAGGEVIEDIRIG
jgi:predicted nucleic acid-binding Zn ribbon protein